MCKGGEVLWEFGVDSHEELINRSWTRSGGGQR